MALPIGIVVSCGNKTTTAAEELKVIKMNFAGNNLQKVEAVKEFKNDIYDAKLDANSYTKFEIDLSLPITDGDYAITLAQDEFQNVQNGKINVTATEMSLHEFTENMKSVTGTFHQYSYNKDDAVPLGLDNSGKTLLHPLGTDQHDEAFQKNDL